MKRKVSNFISTLGRGKKSRDNMEGQTPTKIV
jgi:hypothetical protein